jgi:hypothetical protein
MPISEEQKRLNRPWRVVYGDSLVESFDSEEKAIRDRDARNDRAKDLGVGQGYVVVEHGGEDK